MTACLQASLHVVLLAGRQSSKKAIKQSSKKASRPASWQAGWHDSLPACRQDRLFWSIFPNRAAILAA
jgi:hypothetical protein